MKLLWLILLAFILFKFVNSTIEENSADYKNRFGDKDQYSFIEELFGTGLTNEEISKESKRHISSSTEDLKILLKDEKKLLNIMKQDKDQSMFLSYIEEIGLLDTIERDDYVYNPINSFHLMKRAVTLWPKIIKVYPKIEINIPEKKDFIFGASFGLVIVQAYHQLNIFQMAQGSIEDPVTKREWKSSKNMTSEELGIIAATAKKVWRLGDEIEWRKICLKVAKLEGKSEIELKKIQTSIRKAKDLHDKYIYTNGFIVRHPDKDGSFVNTKKQLYQKHLMDHPTIIRLKKEIKNLRENYIVPFKNLNLIEEEWVKNQLPLFIPYFMKDFEVQLCQGNDNGIRNKYLDVMYCRYLDRTDPYLKLGPFKYETLNDLPHIAVIRDFASKKQTQLVQDQAAGKMRSTPLKVNGSVAAYTRYRTSKVMYMNENVYTIADQLSDLINLALKFNVSAKFGSENYQVMNYGMGGTIVTHVDTVGEQEDRLNQENYQFGGPRLTTFMIYLSDVEAGGHTVFSSIGLHVKPIRGDALFWFNLDSSGGYDTRNIHMGCPVVYGNKWIANKWVHWMDQMWNYPCIAETVGKPYTERHIFKPRNMMIKGF